VGLVFACGLLHGLGFAAALSGLGLEGSHRALALLGFNVGIELGQALFVAGLLGLGAGVSALGARLGRPPSPPALARWASLAAAGLGAFWLVQRLAGSS
jgi:hypothetical protein